MAGLPPRPTFEQDFTSEKALQPIEASNIIPIQTPNPQQPPQPPQDPSRPPPEGYSPLLALPVELLELILSHALPHPSPLTYDQIYKPPVIRKLKSAGQHAHADDLAAANLRSQLNTPPRNLAACRHLYTLAQNLHHKTRHFTFHSANLHPLLLRNPIPHLLHPSLETTTSVQLPLHPSKNTTLRLQQLCACFPALRRLELTELKLSHFWPHEFRKKRPRELAAMLDCERVPWAEVVLGFAGLRVLGVTASSEFGASEVGVQSVEGFGRWLRGKFWEKYGRECRGFDDGDGGFVGEGVGAEVERAKGLREVEEARVARCERVEKAARERLLRVEIAEGEGVELLRADGDERGSRELGLSDVLDKRQMRRFL
ncbi:hypothetical protein MBLNU230_g5877t1 [Neophaeotheca triangularis]